MAKRDLSGERAARPSTGSQSCPPFQRPSPPEERKTKLTSTEGLREISQEISSLLSDSTFASRPRSVVFGSHDSITNGGDSQDLLLSSQRTSSVSSFTSVSVEPQTTFPSLGLVPAYTSIAGLQTALPVHTTPTALDYQTSVSTHSTSSPPLHNSMLSFSQSPFPMNTETSSAVQVPKLAVNPGSPSLDGIGISALQQKVKVHAQTIDILVQEKSSLQSELRTLQQALNSKNRESSEVKGHGQAVQRQLEEAGRENVVLNEELARKRKALSQSKSECVDIGREVARLRSALEDQRQEGTELISKVTSQAAELSSLQGANRELQSRLNMANLLAQQRSGGTSPSSEAPPTDPTLPKQLAKAEGDAARLRSTVQRANREKEQALSDLAALRDTLTTLEHNHASKLSEAQSMLSDCQLQITCLEEELEAVKQEKESLSLKLSSEQAQLANSNQVAIETLRRERDGLYDQLQQQLNDNQQLARMNLEQEGQVLELELRLSRLSEQAVDQHSLLTTISQDKETVSRATAQNKQLKSHLSELQDAFIRLSHQNMELASDLETEKHNTARMKRVLDETISDVLPPVPFSEGGDGVRMVEGTTDPAVLTSEGGDDVRMVESENGDVRMVDATVLPSDSRTGSEGRAMQMEEEEKESQLSALLSERTSLLEHLQLAQTQYRSLVTEHEAVLQQLDEAMTKRGGHKDTGDCGEEPGLQQVVSPELLAALQGSFNALQQKFVTLMAEKAELLDRIQEHEHTILKLSGETETIGEYIALYQTQREALKKKFHEKDSFIEQIVGEKLAMQARLRELQALVRQVVADRPFPLASATPPPPPLPSPPHKPHPTPAHPHSDLPWHLQPVEPHTPARIPFEELDATLGEDRDEVSDATAEQILHLLDQLEAAQGGTSAVQGNFAPCACCTGELIVV